MTQTQEEELGRGFPLLFISFKIAQNFLDYELSIQKAELGAGRPGAVVWVTGPAWIWFLKPDPVLVTFQESGFEVLGMPSLLNRGIPMLTSLDR